MKKYLFLGVLALACLAGPARAQWPGYPNGYAGYPGYYTGQAQSYYQPNAFSSYQTGYYYGAQQTQAPMVMYYTVPQQTQPVGEPAAPPQGNSHFWLASRKKCKQCEQPAPAPCEPPAAAPVESTPAEGAAACGDPAASCGENCCPEMKQACAPEKKKCGCWYAAAEVLYVKPRWDNNPAFLVTPNAGLSSAQRDFDYEFAATPRVLFGWENADGLGIRARWWFFSQKDSVGFFDPAPALATTAFPFSGTPLVGAPATASSLLQMHVADLEVTQKLRAGRWAFDFAEGGRYTNLYQTYRANVITVENIFAPQRFEGAGPVVSVEANCRLGCGFSLYSLGRGSVLFGHYSQTETTTIAGAPVASYAASADRVVPVLEIEGGIEWDKPIGRMQLITQLGFVGQTWFGAGNSSDSSPSMVVPGLNNPGNQSRSNLGFLGLTYSIGVVY